jgi:hypothetical protein
MSIKNSETKHLVKLYSAVIAEFDRQQMRWNPVVQDQQRLERKHRDISGLALVARDSKHSRAKAHSEFKAVQRECHQNQQKREAAVPNKKRQLLKMESGQPQGTDGCRIQPSFSSHDSQLRSRVNKQMRERRKKRYRQLTTIHQRIRD